MSKLETCRNCVKYVGNNEAVFNAISRLIVARVFEASLYLDVAAEMCADCSLNPIIPTSEIAADGKDVSGMLEAFIGDSKNVLDGLLEARECGVGSSTLKVSAMGRELQLKALEKKQKERHAAQQRMDDLSPKEYLEAIRLAMAQDEQRVKSGQNTLLSAAIQESRERVIANKHNHGIVCKNQMQESRSGYELSCVDNGVYTDATGILIKESALIKRINRILARKQQRLYKTRLNSRFYCERGDFYISDVKSGGVAATFVDPADLYSELKMAA